jgi:peptidyl-prolyl cis-trans isomerase B (cyclophilin B)
MKRINALSILLIAVFSLNAQFTYTYTGKPRFQILTTQNSATLGVIIVELFPRIAPLHVRNFDSLVSKQFYDSTAFHRVVPGFVIQGGDPNSKSGPVSTWGFGQPWQPKVKAEFSAAQHLRGILSAARSSNINSATSQFFICVAAAPNLNGQYSVYGRVTSGMNIVDQIVSTPTVVGTQRPVDKVEMFITYIGSNDTVPLAPTLNNPKNDSSYVDSTNVVLKWLKVQDAVFYHLDVSLDSLFQKDTIRSVDLAGQQYALNPLMGDTVYYWRVKANNGGHISTSQVWHFRTQPGPNSNHELESLQVLNTNCDSLKLVVTTNFPFGAGSYCPLLKGYTFKNEGGLLVADLYYNISGSWPQAGCQKKDTLKSVVVPENFIQIKTNTIFYGDTTFAINDTTIFYCSTVGIEKIKNGSFLSFPNPSKDFFVIKTPGLDVKKIMISLYDQSGKELNVKYTTRESEILIDARDQPGGVYTVGLKDEDGVNKSIRLILIK